jgi:CrcB protein
MARFLWVCVGGAIGSGARYLVAVASAALFGPSFPWGTLAVNLVGSFFIGAIMEIAAATDWIPPTARLFLTAGVIGGLTTYSSFNFETVRFVREGAWRLAGANFAATAIGCFLAGLAGIAVCHRFMGVPSGI